MVNTNECDLNLDLNLSSISLGVNLIGQQKNWILA